MRRIRCRRMIAFIMSFIMALSVLFQTDIAIGGFAEAMAAEREGVTATPTDADDSAQLADTTAIDLNADGYYCYLKNLPNGKIYTGKEIKINNNIGVKKIGDTAGTTALSSSYYTITYENNINAGTATAIVTGNPEMNCTGTLSCTFQIRKKTITNKAWFYLDGTASTDRYSVNSAKYYTYQAGGVYPKIYVRSSATGPFLTEGKDYTLYYVNVDEASEVINEHMGNGPTVTVYPVKNGNYAIGGDDEYFDIFYGIKPAKLADQIVNLEGESFVYTGNPITPKVEIIDPTNNETLMDYADVGEDDYEYKVTYSNNTEPGTATVTITGSPNRFEGTITKTFTILEKGSSVKSIADADADIDGQIVYDNTYKKPEPVVTYKGTTLVKGKDYKISYYTNNKNATTAKSKASVTISGMGSYTGSKTISFDIAPRSVDNLELTAADAVYNTANNIAIAVIPTVTVKDTGLGTTLSLDSEDYSLDFSEYRAAKDFNVGEHSFKLKGFNNYTGIKTGTFNIVATNISSAVISVDPVEYTGTEVKPVPSKVTFNNTVLVAGKDYEIKGYENNVELGKAARITITGKGNYNGSATGMFTIMTSKTGMTDVTIPDIGKMTYTGSQIKPDVTLTYNGTELIEGTDYTVSYGANLSPKDTGSVTFTGIGGYAGNVTKTFTIAAKDISANDVILTRNKVNYEYTGSPIKPDITVTYNGMVLQDEVDYKVMNLYTEPGTYNMVISGAAGSSPYFSGMRIFQIVITAPAGEMSKLNYAEIPDQYYTGSEIEPALTITNGDYTLKENKDYVVKTRKDNTDVGVSTIEIEGMGSYSGTKTLEFNIIPKPIEACDIQDIEDAPYEMGFEIEPAVTVKNGSNELTQGVDYTIEFKNNIDVTDEAEAIITAKSSNYTGSVTKLFKITPVSIVATGNGVSITNADVTQEYTGSVIKPAIVITRYWNNKNYTLTRDVDYTVEYANNLEVTGSGEKASVTVTGIGNFTGQKVMRFEISKKDIYSCTIDPVPDQQWTGEAITPVVKVYNGDVVLEKGTDYDVVFSNNTDVGEASYTVSGKGSHYTGKVTKTFQITKEFIDIEDNDKISITGLGDQTYNFGIDISPKFTLSYDGVDMVAREDYSYRFTDNKNVGTATLTVTGMGRFKGTLTYTFNILPYDISDDTLVLEKGAFEYTGAVIKPAPASVMSGDKTIITDFSGFDVTYGENTNAGKGVVEVTARVGGSFTGKLSQTFVIYKKSLTGAAVTVEDVTYTGKEQTPKVIVTCKDGTVVSEDSYEVSYKDNINVGTATVTVTAAKDGNYEGTASGSFKINGLDISKALIAPVEDQTYTGSEIKPDLTITYGATKLVEGKDYTISGYTDNTNVSTADVPATITVKGSGVYDGEIKAEFNIVPASIDGAVVDGVEESTQYTGSAITFTGITVTVGGRKLTTADYSIAYKNNTDASTTDKSASVIVTGKGNYTGTKTVLFEITSKDISGCTAGAIETQTYTGKEIKPEVTVKDGSRTLVKDKDYTVSYSSNTNVTTASSKAKVLITGTGNYKGSLTLTFDIVKQVVKLGDENVADIEDQVYHMGDSIEPEVVVTVGGEVIPSSEYTVTYVRNINVGTATVTVTGQNEYAGTVVKNFNILPRSIASATTSKKYSSEYSPSGVTFTVDGFELTVDGKSYEITDMSQFTATQKGTDKAGIATITVTSKADTNFTGSFTIKATITSAGITDDDVTLENTQYTYTGSEITPEAVVKHGGVTLVNGKDYTVGYEDNKECSDQAKVIVKGTGNYAGTVSKNFTIVPADIENAVVTAAERTYTGKPLTTTVTVTLGEKILTEGTDYVVIYTEDSVTNAGKGRFTVKGQGSYSGSVDGSFTIKSKSIAAEGIIVSGVVDKPYTGSPATQDITVSDGDIKLVQDVDYTVSYENNTQASTADKKAAVIIRGKGNYDSATQQRIEFSIDKISLADAVVDGVEDSCEYTGSAITFDGISVSVSGRTLTAGTDYVISYKNNKNVSTDSKKAEVVISAADGSNYTGSVGVTFTITARSIEKCTVSDIEGQIYTGSPLTPAVEVRDGQTTLAEGTDYDIIYDNNTNVTTADSMAEAVITGKGNYAGTVTKKFAISKRVIDISKAVITITDKVPVEYNPAGAAEPAVTVSLGGELLPEDTYIVSYQNNKNAGKATITVTGTGEYKGVVTTNFEITQLDISGGEITLENDSYGYTGDEIKPAVTGITVRGMDITPGSDFDVAYSNNVKAGKADVTVTARANSNYKGIIKGQFTITASDISEAKVQAADQEYTGSELKPVVTVYVGERKLAAETDYTVEYSDNINVGKASILVTGTGNYTGAVKGSFAITAKSIGTAVVTVADQIYTGEKLTPEVIVTLDGKVLPATEYDTEYASNVNKGTAYVTVIGKHNHSGQVKKAFEITAMDISVCDVGIAESVSYTGSEIKPDVTVKLGDTVLEKGTDFEVEYSDNINVTTQAKKAKAVITGYGNFTGRKTVTFEITPADFAAAVISGIPKSVRYTGKNVTLSGYEVKIGDVKLAENIDYVVTYTDNVEVGKAAVKFAGIGNYSGDQTVGFEITKADINDCDIVSIPGQKWTGSEIKPDVTVKNGSIVLVSGKDYTVTYANNTDVTDKAEAVITGKGNYEGSKTVHFSISRSVVDISTATVSAVKAQIYNMGKAITPSVDVICSGISLKEGVDYTLVYEDNINVGTARMIITGMGYYSGTKTVYFTINAFDVSKGSLRLDSDRLVYTGKAQQPLISGIVISDDVVITDMDSFDVACTDNVNVGTATVVVTAKTAGNYTGSVSDEFEIVADDLSEAVATAEDAVYQGTALTPAVKVSYKGSVLTEGKDYKVSYSNNVKVGKGSFLVTGIGNYSGNVSGSFNITERTITDADVYVDDQVYIGREITPDVKVVLGGKTLVSGTDYTVSYDKNENVGTAVVIIEGTGNYKGRITDTFKITQADIADAVISAIEDQTYTGKPVTPVVSVSAADGTQLNVGIDYEITYSANMNVTTDEQMAYAVITGKGNYAGTAKEKFRILPRSLSGAAVSGYSDSVPYTGSEVTFADIVVTCAGEVLTADADYTVKYVGNSSVTADDDTYFVVTGCGNYTGEKTVHFTITKKNISDCDAQEIESQVWTGKEIKPDVTIKNGTILLVNGVDYDITYSANVAETTDTAKAKAVVTGKGNYTGKIIKEFVIARKLIDISGASVKAIPDQTYAFGRDITPAVTVTLDGKNLVLGEDYKVDYSDNVNVGTATVTITGIGGYNKSLQAKFKITPEDMSKAVITLKGTAFEYTGDEITPAVVKLAIVNGDNTEILTDLTLFDVKYKDNVNAGTAKVYVSAGKNANFTGTAEGSFEITRKSIAGAVVSTGDVTYTGKAVVPEVKAVIGDKELVNGTDYTVTVSESVDAGTAECTITGKGNYEGVIKHTFEIKARSIADGECSIPSQIYTGYAITPDVKLVVDGVALKEGTDYTVTYTDNKDVTSDDKKATAVIKAMGNYTGRLIVNFDITAKKLTADDIEDIAAQEYTGHAIEPALTVKNGDVILVAGRDYEVTYSNNIDKTVDARATVKGKGNYQGTVTKVFEICGASIADAVVLGVPESAVYTGDSITFDDISVVMKGETLVYGSDYTISYENNVNVTTADKKAYVVVKGIDNYGGQIRTSFDITPKNLETCKVDAIEGQIYTGSEVTPDVTVRDGLRILEKDTDYTVDYTDNVKVGKNAKAIITGKGNYTGSLTAEFTIAKEVLDISNAQISAIADQYYDFAAELTPDVTVKLGSKTLIKDVDYSVTYTDNVNVGIATATVKGINQNKGEVSRTFKILPVDVTGADITLSQDAYEYTGSAVRAQIVSVTVTRNGVKREVTDLTPFEITYADNTNVGTATVKAQAIENQGFVGTAQKNFKISAALIDSAEVTVGSAVYTGKAIIPECSVVAGGRTLASGVDYTVTASDNVDVTDSAKLTIKGIGNYAGSVTTQFVISPKRISLAEVKAESAEYTGAPVETAVEVVLDGITLKKDVDYTLSYSDNVDVTTGAAKAVVTVTGIGNYTGTVSGEFAITPMDISKLSVDDIPAQVFGGSQVCPGVVIRNGKITLSEGVDYTVEYENNSAVTDEAKAVITGIGNYTGTVTRIFEIKAYSIEDAEVSGITETVVYTGQNIEFTGIKVTVNGRVLEKDTDYTVKYENNLNVTKADAPAYVVITGTGNYGGQVRKSFAITEKNIARCSVDPIGGQIYTGTEVKPEVVVRDGTNVLTAGTDYTVEYSKNIDVTDRAEVTITGIGNYKGSVSVTFTIAEQVVDISKAQMSEAADQYYNFGNAIKPEVTLTYEGKKLTQDKDYELVYINNVDEGTATIQANGINKNTGSVSMTFAIKPIDITKAVAVLENDSYEYTGSAVKPDLSMITVDRQGKSETVTSFDAFDIAYSDNENVGTAKAVITARKGSGFTGSVSVTFVITGVDISDAVVSPENVVYTGSAVKPAYTVTLGGKKLVAGRDFTAAYTGNVNVGNAAMVTVTGTGNYKGSAVGYFAITAKSLADADITVADAVYTGKPVTPAVTVTVDGEILNEDIDYTVTYSNNIDATTAKVKASVTVKGTGNYEGMAVKTFDIMPKSIENAVIGAIEKQKYTGSEIRPDVRVTLDKTVLVAGADYTVTYENNIEAGNAAVVTVTGKGNYTGSVQAEFVIENVTIEDAEITGIDESVVYTGREITFDDILVTIAGRALSDDEDYTVTYRNNINVTDRAEVIITGKGNYSGEISKTFAITAKDISKCDAEAISGQIYTGKEIEPDVTIRDGSNVLKAGTDYTVTYSNNTKVTTADSMALVTVKGCGNYKGTLSIRFAISKNVTDISKAVISKVADQLYNMGQPLTPDVTVTNAGKTLERGVDYAISYVDNVEEGTATVIAKGINAYTGSVSTTFKIGPVDISDGQIAIDAATYMYTGTAVKPSVVSFTVKRAGRSVTLTDYDNLDISYSSNTDVGTGIITITALPGEGFTGSVSKTFKIVGASVENASVKVDNGVYTGEAVTPAFTVSLAGRTLTEGVDFRADFSNNINVTDSAVLTITGINNYSGTKTARFRISARKLTDADINAASVRYTGSPLTPSVTVILGGVTLEEDRDFTVSYSDNVNVTTETSKASVVVTGIGNYTGTAVETFDITPRDISLAKAADIDRQNYTGSPVTPDVVVMDGERTLEAGKDYTVSYKNNVDVTNAATAVITGKGNYQGSISKLFAIGGADISDAEITGIKDSVTYTGREITFAGLKVYYDDEVLVEGRDYTVTYSGNKNITDSAKTIITGMGNYTGRVEKTFAIVRRDISDCHVSEIEGQLYTGKAIEPDVSVTFGDITLVEDVDYEITYSNNVEPAGANAPAKAVITGKGSFTGTVERFFTITKDPVNISGAKIAAIADQVFAKKNITPEITVTYGDKVLTEGSDYKVSYSGNYNVGTATVRVTGYGDYVGSKTATFVITKRDVSDLMLGLAKDSAVYTGKAITPAVKSVAAADGSYSLDDDEIAEFVVRYTDNVNAGIAAVTATAGSNSNYTGTLKSTFRIMPADIVGAKVTAEDAEYTGSAVKPAVTVVKNGVVLSYNDYTVEYSNNIAVGTASLKITGKGNYTGNITGSFEVSARSLKNCTVTCSASTEYTGGQVVPVVTVKNGDILLKEGTDYVLSYDMNTDATGRAKVVVTGKGNYKDSVTRYFAITKKSIAGAEVTEIVRKQFTGHAITQDMEVVLDGKTLSQGTDYTVEYTNNIHAGTATVIITGTGNYTDSVKKSFVIGRVDISKTAVISGIDPEVTYEGSAVKFKNVRITWGSLVLKEGRDYTITYKNNSGITLTRTSKASCTITFAGDYKGRITKQFRIKAFDISKAVVSPLKDVQYDGKAKSPKLTVKIGSVTIGSDEYSVRYLNNKNPGIATAIITGLNNFYGTKVVTFRILPNKPAGLKYEKSTVSAATVSWKAVTKAAGYVVYRYDSKTKKYVKVKSVTGTRYTVGGLKAGTSYTIAVAAYVKTTSGKIVEGNKQTVAISTYPGKPTGVKVSSRTDKKIVLGWKAVTGASGYNVYRYNSAAKKSVFVKRVTGTSAAIAGLKGSTKYTFIVKAYRAYAGKRLEGDGTTVKAMTTPSAVTGLKVIARSSVSITLKWNTVANADGYRVYRYVGKKPVVIKTITSNKSTTFVSSKLSGGTEYRYKVTAYKKNGSVKVENAGTHISSVTAPGIPVVTSKPGASKVTLAWRSVAGADGYEVYMSTAKNGRYSRVATLKKAAKIQYVKSGLAKNKNYYFKVRAYKVYGGVRYYSSYSTVKQVKTK